MLNKILFNSKNASYTTTFNNLKKSLNLISKTPSSKSITKLPKFSFTTESSTSTKYRNIIDGLKKHIEELNNPEQLKKKLEQNLTKEQINRVKLFANKHSEFNNFQLFYFNHYLEEKLLESKKFNLSDTNTDWISILKYEDKTNTQTNMPNQFFEQQNFMSNLTKWLSQQEKPDLGLSAGNVSSAVPESGAAAEKVEEKEEVKEKTAYDVELSSFDAAKKIAIIKEVRTMMNLGLKEAKEVVEKAPTVLMKGVNKEEAENIEKKLSGIGAKILLK